MNKILGFYNNEKHFLHAHLTFLESAGIDGKDEGFPKLLSDLGIAISPEAWDEDHSTINWKATENHHQFFFGYEGDEDEIKIWLRASELNRHEYLYTWLSWNDPIIKIRTQDFIENWQEFITAGGGESLAYATLDGKLFLEFTDDWKHHLNSNFEIKPGTGINRSIHQD